MQKFAIDGTEIEICDLFDVKKLERFFDELAEAARGQKIDAYIVVAKHFSLKKELDHLINTRNFVITLSPDMCDTRDVVNLLVSNCYTAIREALRDQLGGSLVTYAHIYL